MLGHSVGDLICAYADGCHTAEETILSKYWRGRCLIEANLPKGGMAAIGKQGITWLQCVLLWTITIILVISVKLSGFALQYKIRDITVYLS